MSTTERPLSRWGTEAHRPSAQEPALQPAIQQPGMVPAGPEGASPVADGHAEVSSSYQDAPWRPLTLSSCVHTAQKDSEVSGHPHFSGKHVSQGTRFQLRPVPGFSFDIRKPVPQRIFFF